MSDLCLIVMIDEAVEGTAIAQMRRATAAWGSRSMRLSFPFVRRCSLVLSLCLFLVEMFRMEFDMLLHEALYEVVGMIIPSPQAVLHLQ